eukprot:CAMPEP_0113324386 /NCGR_PEP_ID=MMETSP0010_2-20120614/17002_1 /TAXON_ID=216773 ORGANISM="Corethron hystrix, Strain 308" /NCGR_SAMPLE_ID=MMETSP0010_2 /ASSEMBLY_ACC=CAM_ASM_000155 /LENGTH=197 /DNA_ID=CAMNT_0000183731 /DNA_START=39 /DNA_END=631 /DNA_ORIENTATION=- /assembly_acc=CAM_ASM_000155
MSAGASTSSTSGPGGSMPAPTAALAAGTHVSILHLDTSAAGPTGDVSKAIKATLIPDQRTKAEEFFTFLTTPNPTLARLNEGNNIYMVLVNVPKTLLVKIVYGLGLGSSPIGTTASAINGKLLLHGNGNKEIGPPQPLVPPPHHSGQENSSNNDRPVVLNNSIIKRGTVFIPVPTTLCRHNDGGNHVASTDSTIFRI